MNPGDGDGKASNAGLGSALQLLRKALEVGTIHSPIRIQRVDASDQHASLHFRRKGKRVTQEEGFSRFSGSLRKDPVSHPAKRGIAFRQCSCASRHCNRVEPVGRCDCLAHAGAVKSIILV